MTEEDGILCHELTNAYWKKFSQLVALTLRQCPAHLRDELMAQLQDHSSVYGSGYNNYMTVPKVILVVGAPGSGKTTWGIKYATENGFVRLCPDEFRAKFGTGEHDQSVSDRAFAATRIGLEVALAEGKSAFIDACNMYPKTRRQFLDIANRFKVQTEAVVFEVPRDTLIERNKLRGAAGGRDVGVEVIDRMLQRYRRPSEGELDIVTFICRMETYEQQPINS